MIARAQSFFGVRARDSRHHRIDRKAQRATPRQRHSDSCAARSESATGSASKCPENEPPRRSRSAFRSSGLDINDKNKSTNARQAKPSKAAYVRGDACKQRRRKKRSGSLAVIRRSSRDAHGIISRRNGPRGRGQAWWINNIGSARKVVVSCEDFERPCTRPFRLQ